jgi:AbrB family looped-hinge helix DNA binding protein
MRRTPKKLTARAKITSKGQVTIPVEIRRALGVGAGDELVFEEGKHGVVVTPRRAGESVFAKYQGIGNPGIGSGREQILAYFRELRGHDNRD